MTEQWAVIEEFPAYEVSNLGRVRRGGRVKTLRTDHNGYTSAVLWRDSVSHTRLLGPLVAIAFIGPRPDGLVLCHNDGDATHNSATNLRWDTRSANEHDKREHGTARVLDKHLDAKLKEWEAQGDKAYKRGFSDGMKEAPTGESWIRAIDEAMVGAHIGVAEMADDYGTAKKKLNALICWSVQVDRDLSRAQAAPVVGARDACVWTPDTDYETDVHYSACGEAWAFTDGGPKENNVRFCQGCGKPVVIAFAQPQQKEG